MMQLWQTKHTGIDRMGGGGGAEERELVYQLFDSLLFFVCVCV